MGSVLFVKVVPEGGEPSVIRFEGDAINIGRVEDNDLVLDHASVSNRHARVLLRDGRILLTDLKSETGTFLGGRRLESPFVVREPLPVRIGAYTLELHDREPPGPDESRFLGAIKANPKDDATRAVYGDWLEEHGRLDEAEFLRAQLTLKDLAPGDPRFHPLASRLEALASGMPLDWRRTLARPPIEQCPVRFELLCPKQWDALTPTASPDERWCDGCKKTVHYAPTIFEAQRLAMSGRCIAVDVAQKRSPNDLAPRPPPMLAGMIAPPPLLPPPPEKT